jgi:multidrug efflux pump subunit AcrA (membrane-fusion protein)
MSVLPLSSTVGVLASSGLLQTEASAPDAQTLGLVLSVQAELLSASSRAAAAQRWVDTLARDGQHDRVALAFLEFGTSAAFATGQRLDKIYLSGGVSNDPGSSHVRGLLTAMHEALDQRAHLLTPPLEFEAVPRIRAAQHQLIGNSSGSVACVLLSAAADSFHNAAPAIGVLCVQRSGDKKPPLSTADMAEFQHMAAFGGPVLQLLDERDYQIKQRLARWWRRERALGFKRWRVAIAGGAALTLAALTLWPADLNVSGHARVEGATQRMLSAPVAGFLKQVHVRPGDLVKEGQLLLEMADQELLVERERWSSQLAQSDSTLAEANAKSDRSQLVIGLAKSNEMQAQLDLVQSQLDRSQVRAPFDAVVVHGDLSQRLGAPLEQGAELMTLAPAGRFRVIVEVDEADIAKVSANQEGTLALSALPWDSLPLRVARITPMATTLEGRNVFEVEAELTQTQTQTQLRPGLAGHARIHVGQRPVLVGWLVRAADRLRLAWWSWFG